MSLTRMRIPRIVGLPKHMLGSIVTRGKISGAHPSTLAVIDRLPRHSQGWACRLILGGAVRSLGKPGPAEHRRRLGRAWLQSTWALFCQYSWDFLQRSWAHLRARRAPSASFVIIQGARHALKPQHPSFAQSSPEHGRQTHRRSGNRCDRPLHAPPRPKPIGRRGPVPGVGTTRRQRVRARPYHDSVQLQSPRWRNCSRSGGRAIPSMGKTISREGPLAKGLRYGWRPVVGEMNLQCVDSR